jgi:hypothetical protein
LQHNEKEAVKQMKTKNYLFWLLMMLLYAVTNNVLADNKSHAPMTGYLLYDNTTSPIPYRIPAIACTRNGDLIALSDYRQGKRDIGYGAVDVYARISRDNGNTWGAPFCLAGSKAVSGSDNRYYGDASIIADREHDEVLVMLVSGTVGFPRSTREAPVRMASMRGHYDRVTGEWKWTRPMDITTVIYDKLPQVKALFFSSGRICQSTRIKVGSHYRLYAGLCVRTMTEKMNANYVMYSDDFGKSWNVLGGEDRPALRNGDECKCEELPDGNVLLSSRVNKGRTWNIFTYEDRSAASGHWGTGQTPDDTNSGIYNADDQNACNGEILIVDAIRLSDHAQVKLALQSVATNRTNVTIWYKPLTETSDYDTPQHFARAWEGKYQVSNTSSCYSTMIRQPQGFIGFFFEENAHNSGYDMIYLRMPLETITHGQYGIKE